MTTKTKSQEKHKMSEIDDHILKYFDIKKRLGKGAYGIVWKAIDKKTNQTLAVKKIFDAFRDETDAQRTFREIMFLRAFRNHPNVIQLHNVYKAANNLDIYLSFEFMESDLHNVIKKGNILKDVHKRYIMYQLLNAIKYIHSGNVIHRDLKPSNVLIDTKCRCKLADFGLARSVSDQQLRDSNETNEQLNPVLTDYVATRWYRAPEILVASKRYTKGIDMWSLGCILGEMIRGKPIFQGSSTVNQIEKIVSALPEITEQDIRAVGAGFGTALLNKQIPSNNNVKTLDDLLIDGTDDGNNLVKRLLVLDPLARLTATEALNHKYVEKFRHSVQETELNVDVRPPFRDDVRLSVSEYRSKLYEIVQETEKAPTIVKANSFNRKREPRSNNKSLGSIPSKYVDSDEKVKRSIYRSQERKSYIPQHEASTSVKTTTTNSNKKFITQTTSNSGTIPKPQTISSLNNEQVATDLKASAVLTRTKYIIKPPKSFSTNSMTKGTTSSPEVNTMQRTPLNSKKFIVDKRHSIDGSYDSGEPVYASIYPASHMAGKDKRAQTLHTSYSSLGKQNEKPTDPSSRIRRSSQNASYIGQGSSSSSSQYLDSGDRKDNALKFDDYSEVNAGSNYYEKRLKRLEEQIEKHKREVKAFCSENTKYSKSLTFQRNSDPSCKDKYSTSSGSGKSSELQPKEANKSRKIYAKHNSTSRFEYLYAGGDDSGYRQGISSKYDNRKPSKII